VHVWASHRGYSYTIRRKKIPVLYNLGSRRNRVDLRRRDKKKIEKKDLVRILPRAPKVALHFLESIDRSFYVMMMSSASSTSFFGGRTLSAPSNGTLNKVCLSFR
jgi:hypothetical protein